MKIRCLSQLLDAVQRRLSTAGEGVMIWAARIIDRGRISDLNWRRTALHCTLPVRKCQSMSCPSRSGNGSSRTSRKRVSAIL